MVYGISCFNIGVCYLERVLLKGSVFGFLIWFWFGNLWYLGKYRWKIMRVNRKIDKL